MDAVVDDEEEVGSSGKTYHTLSTLPPDLEQHLANLGQEEGSGSGGEPPPPPPPPPSLEGSSSVKEQVVAPAPVVLDQAWLGGKTLQTDDGQVTFQLQPVIDQELLDQVKVVPRKRRKRNREEVQELMVKLPKFDEEVLNLTCEWEAEGEEAEVCGEIFREPEDFSQHVELHMEDVGVRPAGDAADAAEETAPAEYLCRWSDCGYTSASSRPMIRHIYFHAFHTRLKLHGQTVLKETGLQRCTLSAEYRNQMPELNQPIVCAWRDCPRADPNVPVERREILDVVHFYQHVRQHGEHLKSRYRKDEDVDQAREDGKIVCRWQDCRQSFVAVNKLICHMRSHSQERKVGCPHCGGLFASRTKFYDHCKRQVNDTDKLTFQCDFCSKTFAIERLLRDHMRAHINHYKCPLCELTFPSPSTLTKHMSYKHSNVKPHACSQCPYRGKRHLDLLSHMETHKKKAVLKCPYSELDADPCAYTCKSEKTLEHHIGVKHEGKWQRYCCHLCDKRYLKGQYLTRHLVNFHRFLWPAGHTRFRYMEDAGTGLFHLQTLRFESEVLDEAIVQEVPQQQGGGGDGGGEGEADEREEDVDDVEALKKEGEEEVPPVAKKSRPKDKL